MNDAPHADDILWDSTLWMQPMEKTVLVSRGAVDSRTVADAVRDGLARENADLREALESSRSDVSVYRDLVSELLATVARLQKDVADAREQLWQWRRERL